MDERLVAALITQVGIPEFLLWLHRHHDRTGELPTDAEMVTKLGMDADAGIALGETWLDAHPPTG